MFIIFFLIVLIHSTNASCDDYDITRILSKPINVHLIMQRPTAERYTMTKQMTLGFWENSATTNAAYILNDLEYKHIYLKESTTISLRSLLSWVTQYDISDPVLPEMSNILNVATGGFNHYDGHYATYYGVQQISFSKSYTADQSLLEEYINSITCDLFLLKNIIYTQYELYSYLELNNKPFDINFDKIKSESDMHNVHNIDVYIISDIHEKIFNKIIEFNKISQVIIPKNDNNVDWNKIFEFFAK